MKKFFPIFFVLLLGSFPLKADQQIPYELQGVGIDDKTGQSINLDLPFKDENGTQVNLKNYFNKKPVLLALVYFGCPNLCTLVLNSTMDSLKEVNLTPGKDFDVVAISFDPKEGPSLAQEKKAIYLKEYGKAKPIEASGFHFLTGDEKAIASITSQMGFHFKWDKESEQYAHASAIFILTPQGKVSRIFYGVMYPPRDVRLGLVEAGEGKIGTLVDQFLLFCFHYDAAAKKYVILAKNLMTLGGAIMLAVLAIFMALFWSKEIKLSRKPTTR